MRSDRIAGWLAAGGTSLLLAVGACFACGDATDAPRDGGTDRDAGAGDGGRDAVARVDAGRDASQDADGGPVFTQLPGLPEWCHFEVALDPSLVEPLRWQSCFDARPACQELVVDWGDTARDSITLVVPDAFNGIDQPIVAVARPMDLSGRSGREMVITREDGTPVYATRSLLLSGECGQGVAMSGNAGAFVHSIAAASASPDESIRAFVVDERLSDGARDVTSLSTVELLEQGLQDCTRSATGLIGLEIAPALRVGTLRDGVFHMTDAGGAVHNPVAVGDYLLFDFYDSPRRSVMKENPDFSVESYLSVPDADVMMLRSDGEWLAWMEGGTRLSSSTHWASRTVRAARFTPDGAALEPQTVVELGEGWLPWLGVGGGWVVAVDRPSLRRDVIAVNLATLEQRTISPPEGHAFQGDPVYVTPTEVALRVAHLPSLSTRTIFKVSLAD